MAAEPDYGRMRARMVRNQLKRRGIADEDVLAAMGRVPREAFVPENLHNKIVKHTGGAAVLRAILERFR